MNRRRFLAYALTATAGAVAVGTWRWNVEVGSTVARFEPDDDRAFEARLERLESVVGPGDRALLLALPPDLESAVAVGRHAVPPHAPYRDESAVLERLRRRVLEPWRRSDGTHAALRAAYRAAVARDHQDDRTVVVGGWLLAATRVELCALALHVRERVGPSVIAA